MTDPLLQLRDALREFAAERDWERFHSPKNLAATLAVEAAELLEPFQWLTEAQSRELPEATRVAVEQELADVPVGRRNPGGWRLIKRPGGGPRPSVVGPARPR